MKKILNITILSLLILFGVTQISATANAASRKDGTLIGSFIRTTRNEVGYVNATSYATCRNIPANIKLVILASKNSRVKVKYGSKYAWISNRYLLLNAKDFIPSLHINLSLAKKKNGFNMGNESIPGLSNKRYYNSSGSINGTEAWLRFNTAYKLLRAERSFLKSGYRIVVYDAYRPYSVTTASQKVFRIFLNSKSWAFKNNWFGLLGESWFLAQYASSHNYGVAVDIGLENSKTGKAISMPSKPDTLDKRSAYYFWVNKGTTAAKNAAYLKRIMESCGFTFLQSEWWHFQDNDIYKSVYKGNVINLAI